MKNKEKTVVALCNIHFLSTGENVKKGDVFAVTPEKAQELINSNLAREDNANEKI